MAQQTTATSIRPVIARTDVVPAIAVRVTGALLALAVATVHVADQGGITALATPGWIGWSYRAIEVGAVLTAIVLLVPDTVWPVRGWITSDFSVRLDALRLRASLRPSHPAPNVRDDREAPLLRSAGRPD